MRKFPLLAVFFAGSLSLLGLAVFGARAEAAYGGCGARVAEIVRSAYPSAKGSGDGTYEFDGFTISVAKDDALSAVPQNVICRVWPARPELTLVAVPLMSQMSDDGNTGDLEVLVVDSATNQVKQRQMFKNLMSDDALHITSLSFDTAFYQLAPGRVAFGLRLSEEGSSRPNPFGDTSLRLFDIDGDQLRLIVDGLLVEEMDGEWDTNCAGEFHNTKRTLSMQPSKTKDFADILIAEARTTSINTPAGDDCKSEDKTSSSQIRLRYNGTVYPLTKGLTQVQDAD